MAQDYASGRTIARGVLNTLRHVTEPKNTNENRLIGDTYSGPMLCPGQLQPGTNVRIVIGGTAFSNGASTETIRVFWGPRAHNSLLTASFTTAASGGWIEFVATINFTFYTIGASGTVAGVFTLINNGTTGMSATTTKVIPMTASAVDTTTEGYFSVSWQSSVAGGTFFVQFYFGTLDLFY